MEALFASPGMIATMTFILVIQAISILLMILNMHVFRSQSTKYRLLFRNLENEAAWHNPGRFLLPLYALATLSSSGVMIWLFVFQPHLF